MYPCFGSKAVKFGQAQWIKDRFRLRFSSTGQSPSSRPSF